MAQQTETQQQDGRVEAGSPSAGQAPAAAPVIRLHLWLERGEELYFGMGRAQLLMNVERLGSIKRAAEHMGMSYRAAWGKLQQSERALGVKLLENRGAKCEGLRLTEAAKALVSAFETWFAAVERASQEAARSLLPFGVQPFAPAHGQEARHDAMRGALQADAQTAGRSVERAEASVQRNAAALGAAAGGLAAGAQGLTAQSSAKGLAINQIRVPGDPSPGPLAAAPASQPTGSLTGP